MRSEAYLADTSAWIEHFRGASSPIVAALHDGHSVAHTEPVLMEVLAGSRSDRQSRELRNLVIGTPLLPFDPAADFEAAAGIYGIGRRSGITIGHVDCMILSVARRTKSTLLTGDRGQARVGELVGVSVQFHA